MCNVKRINDFLSDVPWSDCGPGHVVIGDANLDDESIDYCIHATEARLGIIADKPIDPPGPYEKDRVDLWATLGFLRFMRSLPESERRQPGDEFCGGDE